MKLTLVLGMLVLSIISYGQNESSNQEKKQIKSGKIDLSQACNKDKTSWTVQDLPEYAGGNKKLLNDINQLLTIDKNLTGKCDVSFLINCEGKASGFVITEGDMTNDLNKKVIESLVKLQNWKPGKYNNENVDCTYTLRLAVKDGDLMLEK